MDHDSIIGDLFTFSSAIRYVAIYQKNNLTLRAREQMAHSSSEETDKYEELLVNPTLLTIARQRGNIDCGGLEYIIVAYGNFSQLIRGIREGHISVCLEKGVDSTTKAAEIFKYLEGKYEGLFE